ncbi:PREDICTED: von Willebrand factor A domain-containing protein 5B1 isoform X4 [Cercocebus atys]|uniref:von Willebrand factor A domain-containing protein 5B1 isoform X4 n=1 Tax=Cercocebus atys TaxID=9531 RepID=UPI0005F4AAF1|nr:PREDICTED: von Willebrand factor A domain-containing protein 5B1 isoform X4 [Cercocebus atys]
MPGLLNWITGAALPLTASDVTSCVSGYALGLTASLTYGNLEAQPFQGLFVYPLDECTTVIGFEAVIADRVVTVQIKDKAKLESGHFDASHVRSPTVTGNILQEGVSIAPHSCTPGKVTLDEDLERILFVANLGTIAPMENVAIFISTSSELPTLPSGAVRVLLPAVCAPTVPQFCTKSTGTSNQQAQGKDRHCFGAWASGSWNKLCLATLLNTDVSNPMEYEFNFQLEIRGPCLLAGVESPTHEIRADAAPSARSAKSIIITLANKHTFDRPVEILIHPSEPHMPHVLIEKGDMTLGEFDQHLKGRTDFIKGMKKNSSAERKESLAMACDDIQRMRADMGGTNILSPLKWIIRQPVHRGHPRLLFLITDGAVNNTGKVLELLRNHAFSTRCYSFGIGPNVCHRLVKGLASVSKGSAEFLMEGERLQPKMVKSLKKAMAPVLSDVTVEWIFPETTEVLVSPINASSLFPGERLVGYGIVCDASMHISNPRSDKRRRYSMLHSQESSSSVFYHSQDDGPGQEGGDCAKNSGAPFLLGQAKDARLVSRNSTTKHDPIISQRRRAYSTNQITNHKPYPRATTASDPMPAAKRYPLRKARLQDLTNQTSLDVQWWQIDLQPLLNSGQDLDQGPKLRGPGAQRPSLLPQGCQPFLPWGQETQAWSPVRERTSDSRSPGDLEPSHHPSAFETETFSDWEAPAESQERASPSRPATPGPVLGKALVKGLRDSQRLQWEVSFELGPPGPERRGERDADLWSETFHHLAARAIIRDFEQLAEREGEIEQGSNRRYQVSALHTSKACNVISKYTAFVPVDVSKSRYLPTMVEYPNSGKAGAALRMLSSRALAQQWRGTSSGFGRPQTMLGEDSAARDDMEASPTAPFSETTFPGCEKHGASEGPLRSLATNTLSSMKASENLFGSRLNLNKSRLLTRAAKGFLSKPLIRAMESTSGNQSFDYVPLVSLQRASGAFLLNQAFCEATHIPMEKLKWTSPFTCHRVSLTARPSESKTPSPQLCTSSPSRHLSCDSFSLEPLTKGKLDLEPKAVMEHTGKLWATVVGLAWLEHSSASYFTEWELVAAKANSWLEQQEVPEGRTQGTLKAAARQLFVLLRHWDENLKFNMLCYNPNYV